MKEEVDRDTKTTVTITYVKEVSEALSRVFCCHGVAMAMKFHLTLKRMLVHHNYKRTPQENAGLEYQIRIRIALMYTLVRPREDME